MLRDPFNVMAVLFLTSLTISNSLQSIFYDIRSDEGLTLEMSALPFFLTVV